MPHVASAHHPSAKAVHAPAGSTRAATGADRDAGRPFASLLDEVGQPADSTDASGGATAQSANGGSETSTSPSPGTAGETSPGRTMPAGSPQTASRSASTPQSEPEVVSVAAATDVPQLGQPGQPAGESALTLPQAAADLIKDSKTASDTDDKSKDAAKKDTTDTAAQAPAKPAASVVVVIPLPVTAGPVAPPAQASSSNDAAAAGVQGPGATSVLPISTAGAQPAGSTNKASAATAQTSQPAAQTTDPAVQTAGPAADASASTAQAAAQAASLAKPQALSAHKEKSEAATVRTDIGAGNPPAGASDGETDAGVLPPATTGTQNNAASAASTGKPGTPPVARSQAQQPHHGDSQASAGPTGQSSSPGDATAANGPGDAAGSTFTVTANSHTAATSSTSPAAANAGTAATAGQAPPVPIAGIAIAIAGRALAGNNHFEIRLDPPELGRIEVRLKVDRDGQVTSHLIADRRDTLDLLRRDMPGLERALQDAGLKTAGNGLQFSLRDQSGGGQDGSRPRTPNLIVRDDAAPALDASARSYGRFAGRIGGLDIRV